MKILLVDDNPTFLEGLKNLLEAGVTAEICTARNGREALEKAACFAPDAVLMARDITISGSGRYIMNG
jgi:YesN/AraC family two-component response regulator